MPIILPFHPETASATIVIDGVTYRVPLVDSDGHLQVDVLSNALPTGGATSVKQDTMITALQLIDDLRAALDAVQADRLNVNVYRDGASEVKSVYGIILSSSARATLLTPTSGKKVRVLSTRITFDGASVQRSEIYFGTAGDINSSPAKGIEESHNGSLAGTRSGMAWPDGGGPVGDVDEVLSIKCAVNVAERVRFLVVYREE